MTASVGAIKCFKYLYINNAKLDKNNSMKYAILGGNSEIIHLIEQRGISLREDYILSAIQSHHIDILDWLIERFPFGRTRNNYFVDCVIRSF